MVKAIRMSRVGGPEVMELVQQTSSFKEWKTKLGLELYERQIEGAHVAVDTTPMNLQGVHEAARLADSRTEEFFAEHLG